VNLWLIKDKDRDHNKALMQFGFPNLIHAAALARWTRVRFSPSETVSTVFGRDLEKYRHGKPLKRLGACERTSLTTGLKPRCE
jgi:hypothetical protein